MFPALALPLSPALPGRRLALAIEEAKLDTRWQEENASGFDPVGVALGHMTKALLAEDYFDSARAGAELYRPGLERRIPGKWAGLEEQSVEKSHIEKLPREHGLGSFLASSPAKPRGTCCQWQVR